MHLLKQRAMIAKSL